MKKFGLSLKILLFSIFLIAVTSGVLIYFSYKAAYTDLSETIGTRLEAIARTGALMIDGDMHDMIIKKGDEETEAFKTISDTLRKIKKANKLRQEIYTFRREGDNLKFITMSHKKPFIGDKYQIRPEMRPALNRGVSSHTHIYEDPHGVWMSAYAPIFDSQKQISGILDIDIELGTFKKKLKQKAMRLVLISAITIISGIILSLLFSQGIVRKLKYLKSTTEKISTGLLDREIKVKSHDEVGDLAESLERMRVSLKMAIDMIEEKEK